MVDNRDFIGINGMLMEYFRLRMVHGCYSRLTGILSGLMRFWWDIVMGHTGKLMERAWFIHVYTLQCHQTWLINPLQMELWFAGKINKRNNWDNFQPATFDSWRKYPHLSLKQIANLKRSSKVDLWESSKKNKSFAGWMVIFHRKKPTVVNYPRLGMYGTWTNSWYQEFSVLIFWFSVHGAFETKSVATCTWSLDSVRRSRVSIHVTIWLFNTAKWEIPKINEDHFEVVPAAQTRCGTQRGPP